MSRLPEYQQPSLLRAALERLRRHQAPLGHRRAAEAAVLVPITACEHNPELLLTVRAAHLNSHHGEVCFPGGKRDQDDVSLQVTALRETEEELGIHRHQIQLVAPLTPLMSKYGLQVTPWVGLIPPHLALSPNADEIARVFRVPVAALLDQGLPAQKTYLIHAQQVTLPYWDYAGEHIWGLTACILAELLRCGFGMDIPLPQRPGARVSRGASAGRSE